MGWLGRLFHKRWEEERLDAELRFHLEQRVRDYVASGLSREEAHRRANLAFGGLEQVKQDCRNFSTPSGACPRIVALRWWRFSLWRWVSAPPL